MPRPVKCRKVCHFPNVLEFFPADGTEKNTPIVLTVDEYETIRLLDKKGYSQEQCAESMQIARTTVQRIYEIARKKIADALIDGHPLRIEGGDFRICDGQSSNCNLGGCYKQEIYQKYAVEKGEGIMRIAVTIFPSFMVIAVPWLLGYTMLRPLRCLRHNPEISTTILCCPAILATFPTTPLKSPAITRTLSPLL